MHFPTIPVTLQYLSPAGLIWRIKPATRDAAERQQALSVADIFTPQQATGTLPVLNQPALYLTFDDGPVPEVTPIVLDILKQYNAKATFFCVGDNVRKYPELFERLKAEGHSVGNHTFSHLNGHHTDNKKWYEDIEKGQELIGTNLLRPPYGRISYRQVKYLREKYRIIMWSVLTGDYDHRLTKDQVLNNALKYTRDGSIIVFHDSIKASERMLYALPKVLEHFKNNNYQFKAIDY